MSDIPHSADTSFLFPHGLFLSPWGILCQNRAFIVRFFCFIKSYNITKGVIPLNDMLKAALQAKYGMSRKEVIDRIEQAKEQGKLLELYECAMLKFEMEMKDSV